MALPVASSSNTAYATASSVTITKPTGTAVGDLLVAFIHLAGGAGYTSDPAGWSRLLTINTNTIVSYIFATSTEVAATDFTFTAASSAIIGGGMIRVTGLINTGRMSNVNSNVIGSTAASPATHTITVTPTNAESLLLYSVTSIGTAGGSTASGYSIVTSNPTWTEVYDFNSGAVQMSLAYATRTAVTATGNASVSVTNCATAQVTGIMIDIDPAFSSTITESLTMTETIPKSVTKTFTDSLTITETVTNKKGRLWRKTNKPTTTWRKTSK